MMNVFGGKGGGEGTRFVAREGLDVPMLFYSLMACMGIVNYWLYCRYNPPASLRIVVALP